MMSQADYLSVINTYYHDVLKVVAYKNGLKEMELFIIGFLAENTMSNTASDFVRAQNTTKSHVSTSIKSLCEKGYLTQYYEEDNKKSIHLTLTEKGSEVYAKIRTCSREYQKQMLDGFTEKELEMMDNFLKRLANNSKAGLEKRKNY